MTCIEKGVSHELRPVEFGSESHRALHPFSRAHYIDETFDGPARGQPAAGVIGKAARISHRPYAGSIAAFRNR